VQRVEMNGGNISAIEVAGDDRVSRMKSVGLPDRSHQTAQSEGVPVDSPEGLRR